VASGEAVSKAQGVRGEVIPKGPKGIADSTGTGKQPEAKRISGTADAKMLMFFERLFFRIDTNADGVVMNSTVAIFLSYAAVHLPLTERIELVRSADVSGDGCINRSEFVQMCADELHEVPFDHLEMAMDNYTDAQAMFERRNTAKWQAWSKYVDMQTRWILPLTYFGWIVILFNIEFADGYAPLASCEGSTCPDVVATSMFKGLGDASMSGTGIAQAFIVPMVAIALGASWVLSQDCAKRRGLIFNPSAKKSKRSSLAGRPDSSK